MKWTIALALLLAGPVQAAPADDLKAVIADHWAWYLAINPQLASELGDRSGDGRLSDPSLAAADRAVAQQRAFVARIDAIDATALTPADRINRAVLRRILADDVAANGFGQRAMNFTTYYGWHQGFRGLADRSPYFTRADYDSYVGRLRAYPAHNAAQIAVARTALAGGFVQPCAPFAGYEKTITGVIAATPEATPFWKPFASRPAFIADGDWAALQAAARAAITDGVMPAYRDFAAFYAREYAPKCRASVGASAMPDGARYYQARIAEMTTTAMTADQVHSLGQSEVARIRAEMDAVLAKSGFKGTRADYVARLRSTPDYYARTPAELLAAAAHTAKTIDGWMPRLFGRLPRLPYTVKPIPAEIAPGTTTAYYESGAPTAGRAGIYRVNTSKLDQRPLFELPALTAHEAVPGHHHQIALAQELDLPPFRREAASFTAFVEGWALYAERLGIEMGLYDTPEKDMGRLSYEMWRACRLVVDTGMHAKGWSKQQAIDFMLENTALSAANIEAEVNRYISWPGQALGYKIGELTIRRLRLEAETALGPRFDQRAFHDAVLENGAIPLDVLEGHIRRWIAREQAKGV